MKQTKVLYIFFVFNEYKNLISEANLLNELCVCLCVSVIYSKFSYEHIKTCSQSQIK